MWRGCTRGLLVAGIAATGAGGSLLSCGGSFVSVGAGSDTEAGPGDGSSGGDGGAKDAGQPEACPPAAPQGTCTGSLTCTYGCTSCFCSAGVWSCTAPGCYGGCAPTPPAEGSACGGCCGPSVGMGCDYACPGDAGTYRATCEGSGASGTWTVGPCASAGGTVSCGSAACDLGAGQACCDTVREDAGSHACGSLASGSFCFGGATQSCDEKADCPPGNVCCIQFLAQGIAATCMPTCVTNVERYQACKTSAECESGGPCAQHACPAGEVVQTCQTPIECR